MSCDRYTHNAIDCPRIHFIRKDTLSMVNEKKNILKYKLQIAKKKKYKREGLKFDWKKMFDEDEMLGKGTNGRNRREERTSSLGTTIDLFLKNMTKIQSNKLISNKRIKRLESKDSRFDEFDFEKISHHLNRSIESVKMPS